MTYWHMQLHPKDVDDWHQEKKLLEEKKVIGIDDSENAQSKQFKDMMRENDIVLIKHRQQPVALVSVDGEYQKNENQDDLNWFKFQRKIEILDFFDSSKELDFKLPAARLSKSVDKNSDTFRFIDSWYKQITTKKYIENTNTDIALDQYKIKSLYIKDLKMFNDFTLSFEDNNDVALPIVVIAGKNGTGKTTILEYLADYSMEDEDFVEIFQTRKPQGLAEWFYEGEKDVMIETFRLYESMGGISVKKPEYKEHIEYLPVTVGDVGNVEKKIVNYYITNAEKLDSFKESLENIQKYINDIFKDLELSFSISKIDYKEKKVFLKNGNKKEFSINELSTGEKTLVSKVLYLYFNDIKNKIILIDEPELSLHPSWQNRILKLYENFAIQNNCQMIIATHSPHIIGSSKPQYLRVLRKKSDGSVEALDNYSKSYGLEFNKVLLEIMGMNETRTPEVEKDLKYIKEQIYSNEFISNDEFQIRWNELEKSLGKDDLDLKLLKLEMNIREKKNVSYN